MFAFDRRKKRKKGKKNSIGISKIFLLDNYQGVLYTKKVRLDRSIDTAKKCEVNDVHITLEADYAVRIVQVLVYLFVFQQYAPQNKFLFTILSLIPVVGPLLILYATRGYRC